MLPYKKMMGTEAKIKRYWRELSPTLLDVPKIDSIKILGITPGSYNLKFHVRVNQKAFNFRINIDHQSGLDNQIEYEYRALQFLEGHRIAQGVLFFDDSRRHYD